MISSWELKFSPVENYPDRYRLILKCSYEDSEEVERYLKQELNLEVSPRFQLTSDEYGIYIYSLPQQIKSVLTEKLFSICKKGIVIEEELTRRATSTSELPSELTDMLSSLVKNMAEKVITSEKEDLINSAKHSKTHIAEKPATEVYYGLPLNPKYTFENFVVGTNNRFTHAAALAVAENPGKTYNPLFIYGGVGLGKTHLMQAIGHYVKTKRPLTKVVYITADKFVSQVIEAIRQGTIQQLREWYSNIELLLVDDVQFMAESESTQEEFFHIFNSLHQYGRQIVLTSDRPPKLLTTLEDRLRSRFEWGLIADIKSPSLETRVAILKKKSEEEHINIDDNILLYVASKLKSNIRELEGFLKRITAYASITNQPVDMSLVKQLMSELLPEEELTEEEKKMLLAQKQQEEFVVQQTTKPSTTTTPLIDKTKIRVITTPQVQTGGSQPAPSSAIPQQVIKPKPISVEEIYKSSEISQTKFQEKIQPSYEPGKIKPDEEFYKEFEENVNIVEAAFFYPEGKLQELNIVKQKFAEVIKKHNLKYKIVTVFDREYTLDHINYHMFVELCKTNKVNVCILLSPPPDNEIISPEDFYNNLVALTENSKIIFEYIPWKDLTKEYRYLNLALDIAISKFKLE